MKVVLDVKTVNLLAERLQALMISSGLEVIGFAKMIDKSETYVYMLLARKRKISKKIAQRIGEKFDSSSDLLYNLDSNIDDIVKKSDSLIKFKAENKNNNNYFASTKVDRKLAYFLEFKILNTDIFENPKFVWEVNDECKRQSKKITSDKLNKALKYLVEKKKLKSRKTKLKLRNGEFGDRIVSVFYR